MGKQTLYSCFLFKGWPSKNHYIFEHLLSWYFISKPFVMLLFRIYQKVFLHHLHNQTRYFGRFDKTNYFIDVTISKWIFDIFLIFSFPMTKRGAFVFTD